MTIYNLGSINADYFYRVPHLPMAGETLAATEMTKGLGGKGANMSVAAARAAAHVVHLGAVGKDGRWAVEKMLEYGIDTQAIHVTGTTGHAIINVDESGENAIVLFPGANARVSIQMIAPSLSQAQVKDWFLTQNETSAQVEGAKLAKEMGLSVAYAAAPFDAVSVSEIAPYVDLLFLNEVEAQQLKEATGRLPHELGIKDVIVTRGAEGCDWYNAVGECKHFAALQVDPIDTTGAGDTFTGYVLACLDRGMSMQQSISLATKAAAIMVTRRGTADVIPDLRDIQSLYGL